VCVGDRVGGRGAGDLGSLCVQEIGSVGGALVIWAACGLISLVGALCYSELGTSVPRSGGDYAYIREALGSLPGFLFLWVAIVVIMPSGNAVGSLTFAYYILQPIFPTCEPPESAVRLIAALAIGEFMSGLDKIMTESIY